MARPTKATARKEQAIPEPGDPFSWVPAQYRELIIAAGEENGVPPELLAAQLKAESNFDPETRSKAGAEGIAQFMPRTWEEWGEGGDPYNPEDAIPAQARYMSWLYDRTGSWDDALAAYNWGIGNLRRHGRDQAPSETRNYIAKIKDQVRKSIEAGGPVQTALAAEPAPDMALPERNPRREAPQEPGLIERTREALAGAENRDFITMARDTARDIAPHLPVVEGGGGPSMNPRAPSARQGTGQGAQTRTRASMTPGLPPVPEMGFVGYAPGVGPGAPPAPPTGGIPQAQAAPAAVPEGPTFNEEAFRAPAPTQAPGQYASPWRIIGGQRFVLQPDGSYAPQ